MLTQWANVRLPATEKHTESLYMVSLKSTFSYRENNHCEVLGVPLDSRHEFQAKRFIGCQATIWRCSPKGKGLRRMHELHYHVLQSEWAHTFPRRLSHIIFIFWISKLWKVCLCVFELFYLTSEIWKLFSSPVKNYPVVLFPLHIIVILIVYLKHSCDKCRNID